MPKKWRSLADALRETAELLVNEHGWKPPIFMASISREGHLTYDRYDPDGKGGLDYTRIISPYQVDDISPGYTNKAAPPHADTTRGLDNRLFTDAEGRAARMWENPSKMFLLFDKDEPTILEMET